MREKLIELANDVLNYLPWGEISSHTAQEIADHLIANGVTIQKWIPVSEPPKTRGIYQVFIYDKEMDRTKVWYGQFSGFDWFVYNIYGDGMRCKVTHWMPLPAPPTEVSP